MPADLSDTTLVVTCWRRPGYLRQSLESWAAVPEAKALRRFIVAMAPSPQEAQMRRVIRSAGIGIAIKVADGNVRALHPAVYSVLDQLGLLNAERRSLLERYRNPAIKNARGSVAGDIRPVFTLQPA